MRSRRRRSGGGGEGSGVVVAIAGVGVAVTMYLGGTRVGPLGDEEAVSPVGRFTMAVD